MASDHVFERYVNGINYIVFLRQAFIDQRGDSASQVGGHVAVVDAVQRAKHLVGLAALAGAQKIHHFIELADAEVIVLKQFCDGRFDHQLLGLCKA